ncbi:MAG TPA: alpha-glucosidase, partial [Allocoleopsis sp.]
SQKGYPPVRPAFWGNSDDSTFWAIDDAFFLGDALLVCPVFEDGARLRNVILPKGRWYSFWSDEVFEGATEVAIEAPLEQMPLLVRAGTILPMESNHQLMLHLYPPVQESSEGCLYSDAGDGYAEWRLDRFRMVRDEKGLELTWEPQGDFAFPYESVQLHLHDFELQQVWVDDAAVSVEGNYVECAPFGQVRWQGKFL